MVIPMTNLSILDGIRSAAVLLVVVCHLSLDLLEGKSIDVYNFNALGHLGVAIFFVHTTFVLLGSLERHGSAVIPFYIRRVFRIYPLSVTVVLLIALIRLAFPQPFDVGRLLSNLFLVQNLTGDQVYLGPLWSLPHEVQMYLVLPALYFMVTQTKRPVLWCLLTYGASVVLAALDPNNVGRFHVNGVTASLLRYAPCFIAGAFAFAFSRRAPRVLHPGWIALLIFIGIALIPLLVSRGVPETPMSWAFCLVIAVMIPMSREPTCQPIVHISKTVATYSYGAYLTHMFAFFALHGLIPGPPVVRWAAMLILLAGLPYVFYHAVEKRGIAFGERIVARLCKPRHVNVTVIAISDKAGNF